VDGRGAEGDVEFLAVVGAQGCQGAGSRDVAGEGDDNRALHGPAMRAEFYRNCHDVKPKNNFHRLHFAVCIYAVWSRPTPRTKVCKHVESVQR